MKCTTFLPSTLLQQAGGGVYVHSGSLHLDRTAVQGNTAAEGGGVTLAGGSRLTASRAQLSGNRLAGGSGDSAELAAAAGADLLLEDGANSEAALDPLPAPGQLSGACCGLLRACRHGYRSALFLGTWRAGGMSAC